MSGTDRVTQLEGVIERAQTELDLLRRDDGQLAEFLDSLTPEPRSPKDVVIAWEAFKAQR